MNNRDSKVLRASAVLTTGYVDSAELDVTAYNQIELAIDFTKGSLTSAQFTIWFKINDTWYQESSSNISAGVSTDTLINHEITATGKYRLLIPVASTAFKVQVKGTGTVTNSLMKVEAVKAQV